MKIHQFIQENWGKGRVPTIDGVLFSDGNIWSFDYYEVKHRGVWGNFVKIRDKNPSVLDFNSGFAEITRLGYVSNIEHSVIYSCGEGGFGGDGYVAWQYNS